MTVNHGSVEAVSWAGSEDPQVAKIHPAKFRNTYKFNLIQKRKSDLLQSRRDPC